MQEQEDDPNQLMLALASPAQPDLSALAEQRAAHGCRSLQRLREQSQLMQSNIQADAVNRKAFVAEMYALMHEIKLLQTTGQQNLQDKMNVRKIRRA